MKTCTFELVNVIRQNEQVDTIKQQIELQLAYASASVQVSMSRSDRREPINQ